MSEHKRTDKAWGYRFNPHVDPRDNPCPMFKDWRYDFACELEVKLDKALKALREVETMAYQADPTKPLIRLYISKEDVGRLSDLIAELEEVEK